MKPLRIAVIGAGHLGKIHARLVASLPQAKLVGISDPSPAAQRDAIQNHDVPVVSDFHKLIDDFDAAIIATPTRFHFDVASQLIEQGKHLLIEKPLTDSVEDAQQLVELASEFKTVVQVGHVERFNAAIKKALQSVGAAKYIIASRMSGYTFRSTDIGVVNDLMIHDIDLVNSIFDGPADDVRASGISVFGHHEDMAQARIQFACGGVANLTASRCSFTPERSFQIFGTRGYANVNLAEQTIELIVVPDWIRSRGFDVLAADTDIQSHIRENLFSEVLPRQTIKVEPVNAIIEEQKDWLNAIQSSSQPQIPVEQGLKAVEVAAQVISRIDSHSWADSPSMSGPLAAPVAETVQDLPVFLQQDSVEKSVKAA